MWVAILALFISVPLMVALGLLKGLSLVLMPITIGIVFPAYVTVTQEIEVGLRNRLARDPDRLRLLLQKLKVLTQSALGEMGGLIAELRPQVGRSSERPTP